MDLLGWGVRSLGCGIVWATLGLRQDGLSDLVEHSLHRLQLLLKRVVLRARGRVEDVERVRLRRLLLRRRERRRGCEGYAEIRPRVAWRVELSSGCGPLEGRKKTEGVNYLFVGLTS